MTTTLTVQNWLGVNSGLCIREQASPDQAGSTVVALDSTRSSAVCPQCGLSSIRAHSRFTRTLHDLPLSDQSVRLLIHARKYFCDNIDCPRQIFTEQFPALAKPSARRTNRLNNSVTRIAFALGGEAGRRLIKVIGFGCWSADTMLRLIRRHPDPPWASSTPRVLGIDDWAKHKGRTYGTILCDMEQHRVVDLLYDRETPSTLDWLRVILASKSFAEIVTMLMQTESDRVHQRRFRWPTDSI